MHFLLMHTTMVAPHQVGDLVRSFVRVPGWGQKKSAKVLICNLSQTSTLASRLLILRNDPSITNAPSLTPSPPQYTNNRHPFDFATHKSSDILQKLKIQNANLRKENEILKKRLSLFKHIIQCHELQQKKTKEKK